MPKKIKPTEIKPTEIRPTEIKPTEIKPTEIKPTEIRPTEIKPTDIKPTEIKPTEIKPIDISSNKTAASAAKKAEKAAKPFSGKTAATYLAIALIGGVSTLILGLLVGLSFSLIPIILGTLGGLVAFFTEMKKLKITQEQLDEWNNEILKKHPNFNKNNLMKIEDVKKGLNRVSFWTHTLKNPLLKVGTWLALTLSVVSLGTGVILPIATGGGAVGSSNVVGTYLPSYYNSSSSGDIGIAVVTAFKFESNGTARKGSYDLETRKYTWHDTGTYTKSGSTLKTTWGTFTIKNGGKSLTEHDGSFWTKV